MADSGKPSATISGADGGGEATPSSSASGGLATAPISSSNASVSTAGSTPSAGEGGPDTGEAAGGIGGKKNHRLHRAEREADFIRMLVRGDFAALHALYESVDTGSEATVLVDASVHYFYTKGPNAQLLLELLKSLIDKEVDSTASPATLFRSNSAAAKMLSATLQHVGTKYLQMTLRRIVHEVCMSNPRIEIDPLKLKPEDNYDENLKRLTSYCELFFNTITKSIEDCPVFVRHVCEYVQMSAVRKFPESKQIRQNLSAVGGLLFLRFFCPAIFTPHKFAVVEAAPGPVALRSLILISKVMQMMANGLRFSDKAEQYMIPMNEFIDKHSADLLNFFSEASMVPSEEEIARLEQKQRQAFQERVLKDISNPLLVKTNDRISQMQDWKNNVALLSPRQARARAGTIESRPIAHSASSTHSGPAQSIPSSLMPSGLVARSAPDLVREMSDDAGDVVRPNTSQQLHVAERERDDGMTSAGSRGATDDADYPPNKKPEANAGAPPAPAAPVAPAPHGSGESHPRRDEREQRADWLDIIHFYLHRNLDKIRVLMQAPELHEDLKHLEKVLSAWTVPEIETEESKRDKERKERERKEKLKEKEQQERRERELIELPAKDSPKEKDKETALEKATRRLLHKKTKNKGELETNPDLLNLEEGEDVERLVIRLKLEKEKEEEQRKHVEKEKENLKKAKEMIEKELIALIDDSKKMRVEIAKLQKDKEMVDYWRGEAEKEKAKSVSMLEEKHQLLVKLARQSDDKAALDADRVRFDAEREQMARERRETDRRVRELEAALKNMTEERDELKETYKAYDARMKTEERERAKKVRDRLAHDDDCSNDVDKYRLVDDFDTSSSSHSISSSTSSDRTKAKERTRKKSEGTAGETAPEADDAAAAERRKERKKKRRTVHLLRTSGEQDKSSSSSITRESQDKGEKEKKDDKKEEQEKKEKKKRDKDDEKKVEKKDKERPAAVGETTAAEVEEMSSSVSSKSSKSTKTAKKEKKEKEKETSEESPADKEAAKEATREKRRSKRTNRTSVKKTKEEVLRDLKSEEEEAQQAQEEKEPKESNRDDSPRKRGVDKERTKETMETKEGVVVIATSVSGSAAASEAAVLPLATSAVVLRQSNRGAESSGDGKNEKNEAGGRAKNEGWVLSDDEDDKPKAGDDMAGIRASETDDGDEDDTERLRKVGKVKTGSYVAPRKSTNPLRKTAEEGSGIRRSRSYDALGYKESSGKRLGGKDIDLKELGKKMRKGLELKSHKHNLKRFENCFRGAQAVEWLMQGAHVESRPDAVEVCRRLLEEGDLFVNLPGLEAEFADDERSVYQFV